MAPRPSPSESLTRALFDERGQRRLPSHRVLSRALGACSAQEAFWVCEMNASSPLYLLPTREWINALAKALKDLGARRVLEVAAGDGFLSAALRRASPRLEVIATDDGSWRRPQARMSLTERRRYRGVPVPPLALGPNVVQLEARAAVARYRPDVTLVSWAPPGPLTKQLLRSPTRFVLDIGTDGDECGCGPALWRRAVELMEGPLERLALCRLDGGSPPARRTRVTLYEGSLAAKDS